MEKTTKEELLQQQLYEGKISWLEYIEQSEHGEEFRKYCESKGLSENEQTAQQFFDKVLHEEEQVHEMEM